jgi:hypothetical protein
VERALLLQPYAVRSHVGRENFQAFVEAIGGVNPNITPDNVTDL